jgi:hypothetical protein
MRRQSTALAFAVAILFAGVVVAPAAAETRAFWKVSEVSEPTHLPPGGEGKIVITVANLGDATANGAASPIVIDDVLPTGLTATEIENAGSLATEFELSAPTCSLASLSCTESGAVSPFNAVRIAIKVKVDAGARTNLENKVSVSGGEAPGVEVSHPLTVSATPTEFGLENFEMSPFNEDGTLDSQAGSHPFELTTSFALNKQNAPVARFGNAMRPVGMGRDFSFALPPGLVGDAQAVPQCTTARFTTNGSVNECQADTAVGVAEIEFGNLQPSRERVPLFNLTPEPGEPARFGFQIENGVARVYLDTSVRSGRDYGVTVNVDNAEQILPFDGAQVTFWGVPGDPRHNGARGWCLNPELAGESGLSCGGPPEAEPQTPLLTLPTACGAPFETSVQADSWEDPQNSVTTSSVTRDAVGDPLTLSGCEHLPFAPTVGVTPDQQAASTPTGLAVDLHVPQDGTLNPTGLAEADVKASTVALPSGMQVSPGAADGLEGCSDAQIGFEGVNPLTGADEFSAGAPSCPNASKLATARIKTPLLANELTGAVYLAAPQNFQGQLVNPFGSLVALYIVAEDPASGVLVKLPGRVTPNPETGQLTATFENTPQLPFEDLKLEFFSSARASLTTPPLCGAYTTTAAITPWSGGAPASSTSSFPVTSGPAGGACSDPRPFAPGLQAGSTDPRAGVFTPFTLTLSRPDADQPLGRVQIQTPPGLVGLISSVKLCGEPAAADGACGEESLIGHMIVSAGLGSDPYTVTGGRVYITTGYNGAPYGLSIVTPAAAGPFVLQEGRPVVVRASIHVDPHTAALTILSDPLPTIIDGIPLQVQHVHITVDRPGFVFNPTNCGGLAVGGTVYSDAGAAAPVSTPFGLVNCRSLMFAPRFSASANGVTSKRDGAGLHVHIATAEGPHGEPASAGEADIAKVNVQLPTTLPSRVSTLNHACLDSQFESDPAGCPAQSFVGVASARTPVLANPLTGPAVLVSHAGAAFPDLVIVLQGEGVRIDLVGNTQIAKGITYSRFDTVPDAPVTSFDLSLPEGPFSLLAANGNLCATSKTVTVATRVSERVHGRTVHVLERVKRTLATPLQMPTTIVAQNGAVINQTTKIAVTGCSKAKASDAKRAKR